MFARIRAIFPVDTEDPTKGYHEGELLLDSSGKWVNISLGPLQGVADKDSFGQSSKNKD